MIEVRGLSKRYGDKIAVNNLSFNVAPGRVTGFLGPNGAGKTTTMRLILGLDYPDAGTVTVDGKQYAQLGYPMRAVGAPGGGAVNGAGGALIVSGLVAAQVGDIAFEHRVRLHELTVVRASLEAAFMELTADSVEYRAEGQPGPGDPPGPGQPAAQHELAARS